MTNPTSEYNISKYDEDYDSSKAIHAQIIKLQAQAAAKEKARQSAIQSHTELTASIMRSHGFKAEIVRNGVIRVSLRNRQVFPYSVMWNIENEELPIEESQLKYICGDTYIYMR